VVLPQRPAEVANETGWDRLAAADEHDRYGRGGSPSRAHDDIWTDDHSHLALHQIRRECWQPIELVLRPAKYDRDVVAVDEARFLQALAECSHAVQNVSERSTAEKPHHRHRRLLRARRERPRDSRAAEQRDELAAPHSRPQGSKPRTASSHSRPGLGTGRGGCELRPIVLGWECRLRVPRPGQNRKGSESGK